ncbi:hypothetical protein DFH27DRAFT_536451 [Peziza echinospora]|nr:hypothetical protein DFH27DRAFT_536451 [Peziza echinospora]
MPALLLLQKQARKLLKLSKSVEQWNNSKYGRFLRVSNSDTLSQLRGMWEKYSRLVHSGLQLRFKHGIQVAEENAGILNEDPTNWYPLIARSAGPLFPRAFTGWLPLGSQI